jgi:hypothetical protein
MGRFVHVRFIHVRTIGHSPPLFPAVVPPLFMLKNEFFINESSFKQFLCVNL